MKAGGRFVIGAVVSALLIVGVGAGAQERSSRGWQYNVDVYVWGSGLTGDVGPALRPYQAHLSFGDILRHLKMAGMAHFEARNDRWGFMVDPWYANLGKTVDSRAGIPLDLKLEQFIGEVAGTYRLTGGTDSRLDFIFGARYNSVTARLTPRPYPAFERSLSWVDPVFGLKGHVRLSPSWTFGYRAEVGGFDVGCKLTWDAVVRLDAKVAEHTALGFGYIALRNNYETGSGPQRFVYDATLEGPFLGVSFRW